MTPTWTTRRIKHCIASVRNGTWGEEPHSDGTDTRCVRAADFNRVRFLADPESAPLRHVQPEDLRKHLLRQGDLVLEKSGGGETQPVGAVVTFSGAQPAVCSNFAARLRPADGCDSRYLTYMFAHLYSVGANTRHIKQSTGIQNLDADAFLNEAMSIPVRLEDQRTIADFLDRETERVDALLAKKQRLIDLLQEKRTALISHAATKGLDPDAPRKDSGIEWLGHVPARWQVMSLSRVTKSRCDGPFGSGLKSDHYTDAGRRVIRLQNIASGRFDHRDCAFVDEDHYREHLGEHDVLPGDLLIAGLGDETHPVGRACVTPEGLGDAMVKADCFRFRLDLAKADPHFLALQLSATAPAASAVLSSGATRTRVNMSTMATRDIAMPPASEQRAIVAHVETASARIDTLTSSIAKVSDRLREYRSALITAAVTGQIDVSSR